MTVLYCIGLPSLYDIFLHKPKFQIKIINFKYWISLSVDFGTKQQMLHCPFCCHLIKFCDELFSFETRDILFYIFQGHTILLRGSYFSLSQIVPLVNISNIHDLFYDV